jgi:hypothetical protein
MFIFFVNYDSGNVAVWMEQSPYVKANIRELPKNFRPWAESEYLLETIGIRGTLKGFDGKTVVFVHDLQAQGADRFTVQRVVKPGSRWRYMVSGYASDINHNKHKRRFPLNWLASAMGL